MILGAVALVCVTVLVLAFGGRVLAARVGHVVNDRMRCEVIVTLRSGAAFRGVLFEADIRALVLRGAYALTPGEAPVVVDGEVIVLRDQLDYLQRP